MNIARFLKTAFSGPRFYVMMDIRYLKVIFYYCKIRPYRKKNFTIDR